MKTLISLLILMATTALPALAAEQAASCSKQSPAHRVALVELFTSEGCSSCPPADKYLGGLPVKPDSFVPLALHVDYWDYIGWKDPFARRTFTDRQRWLSAQVNSRTIYTPEMFVAGREQRQWNASETAVAAINRRPAGANISLSLRAPAHGFLPVEISAMTIKPQRGELFIALYENGISSMVKAGENGGSTLRHDYVVREWIGPLAVDAKATQIARSIPVPPGAKATNLGVAAFVQGEDGEVLQVTALGVCG